MSYLAPLAIAVSAVPVLILCRSDPKRRRAAGAADPIGSVPGTNRRRALVLLACLPGVLLAMTGNAADTMIWLGGCGVAGWLIALAYGNTSRTNRVASNSR